MRPLGLLALIVGVLAAAAGGIGLGARATYGARTSADEPQYLLTAQSLAADLDLDISDELAAEAYRPYHENELNPQTTPVDGAGRRFSPHDPLLSLLLAPFVALGGWVGAKAALVGVAVATAVVAFGTAVRRFEVDPAAAAVTVGAFVVAVPLAPYATQVYPEMAAALALLVVVAAGSTVELRAPHLVVIGTALVVLPWLAVKYVPVAAVAGLVALWPLIGRRRWLALGLTVGALVGAGAIYLVVHQRIYGGWTVYAAGDHFAEDGEFAVIGTNPNYLGRSRRLVGLLVDRRFGLIPWAPIWFLLPAAVVRFATDRSRHRALVLAPLAAGWATATFLALTMHGWWSPGRQIVVIGPLAAIAVAQLVSSHRRLLVPAGLLGLAGAVNWFWLAIEASTGRRTIIVDFFETAAPPYRAIEWLFAPGWPRHDLSDPLLVAWAVGLAGSVIVALAAGRRSPPYRQYAFGKLFGLPNVER